MNNEAYRKILLKQIKDHKKYNEIEQIVGHMLTPEFNHPLFCADAAVDVYLKVKSNVGDPNFEIEVKKATMKLMKEVDEKNEKI
jgi:hypothetical protein